MPHGTCALCRESADLQDGHLIAKGFYKAVREPASVISNPVLVTASTTFQTSEQVSDYLLCRRCELRLAQNGEEWVLRNSPHRNGRFPMREALLRSPIKSTIRAGESYKEPYDSAFDLERLVYFAASVFWRASVHTWDRVKHLMERAPLPLELNEQLRLFLLHLGAFPIDAVLLISVSASKPLPHIIFPQANKRANLTDIIGYDFAVPGLQFRLMYGNIPDLMKQISVAVPPHAVLLTDLVEREIKARRDELRKTSRMVGSLGSAAS
jgi:hypothetical protein